MWSWVLMIVLLIIYLGREFMVEGVIKRIIDWGFGFINDGFVKDLFFYCFFVLGIFFEEF